MSDKAESHVVSVCENSAGYLWVCSCGEIFNYAVDFDAVQRHLATGESTEVSETWAERCKREAIYNR